MKVKLSGLMKPWRVAKKEPAKPPNMAPRRKRRELGVGRVDAERPAGDLVFAQRLPGAADRQLADAGHEQVGDQGQDQDQEIEEGHPLQAGIGYAEELVEGGHPLRRRTFEHHPEQGRARNVGEPVGPAGHLPPVEQDDPDDLAETERHDRQVVAAQAQHGEAEQNAERGGERAGQRQALPKAEIEPLGEEGEGIGTNRIEGDVAEVEQPGQADHDVQAPAEHHVDQHGRADVDDVAVGERHERQEEGEQDPREGDPAAIGRDQCGNLAQRCRGGSDGRRRHGTRADQEQAAEEHRRGADQHPVQAKVEPEPAFGGHGLHPDQRQKQDEGDEGGESAFLERGRPVDPAGAPAVSVRTRPAMGSYLLDLGPAEQAGRPEDQHQDQDRERRDVLVLDAK